MATVYNQIGSLTELLSKCSYKGINFNSFKEIIEFLNNYKSSLKHSKEKAKEDLNKEIENLKSVLNDVLAKYELKNKAICDLLDKQLAELDLLLSIPQDNSSNPFKLLFYRCRFFRNTKKREYLSSNYEKEKDKYLKSTNEAIKEIQERLGDRESNYDKWVEKLSNEYISRSNYIHSVLMENSAFVYGAKGEHIAVEELKRLPDSSSIINNVCYKFRKAVHDRKNDDWIYSAQVDHVVVGPTGIFLIETKNWSMESTVNKDLFSPVKQINRSGHAIYIVLNDAIEKGHLGALNKQWGAKRVSVRKIILLTGHKPNAEYQFVKLLNLSEIRNYITQGETIFNNEEVKALVEYFLEDHSNCNNYYEGRSYRRSNYSFRR